MNGFKDFNQGDVVEYARDGDFVKYKDSKDNWKYDVGTVIQTTPYVKVLWASDNDTTEPCLDHIRLLKDEVHEKTESPKEYYLCMSKEEVDAFMSNLSRYKDEYYCSEYESAQSVIDNLIAFRNKAKEAKAKEAKEKEEQIQKALELLSNSGYTCSKN